MSAPAIPAALLGAGRMGLLHAAHLAEGVGGFQLVVVADPVEAARRRVRDGLNVPATEDWRAAVEDPAIRAVFVCSSTPSHFEHVTTALAAGKHVFCEKPLAATLAEIDEIGLVAARSGTRLQVGMHRRFDPHFRSLYETLRSGRIGKPLLVRISSRDPEPPPPGYPRAPGGIFIDSAVHDFDIVRFLLEEEVVEVSSMGAFLVDPNDTASGDHDTAVTLLRFESGAVGALDNCRLSAQGYDQRVEVHGSAGMAAVENPEPVALRVADVTGSHRPPPPFFFVERYTAAYRAEVEAFRAAIDGAPVPVTVVDGRASLQVALAAARSIQERRLVRTEEIRPE
ncbi:MAG: Gfo/Idh/MocA family protein [Acidimicrobiales bacterium]